MPDQEKAALRQQFLAAMSCAANTVNVVTTNGPAGKAGLTLSAMVSVSADTERPTLLICVHENTATADRIRKNGVFCVNVLRDSQSHISECFAGRGALTGDEKFNCTSWQTSALGCPGLQDALVAFDCKLLSAQKVGTHYLFLGAVHATNLHDDGAPLIYLRRSYATTTCVA